MNRLERLLATALALSARRRLRAADLAERFGVSERTLYRDVSALQRAGFAVEGNAGDGYRLPADAFLRPLALREDEAEALALAAQLLAASADDRLRERLSTAAAKLESALTPNARRRVRDHQRQLAVSRQAQKGRGPVAAILDALSAREVLQLRYRSTAGERTERAVEPLGLVALEGAWLLVGYCRVRQAARAFRVDRIERIAASGETFAPREGLSFAEVLERERGDR